MLEEAAHLGRDLVRAPSSESAIKLATRFVAERLEVPAAGWCESSDGSMALVAVEGLGDRRSRSFSRGLAALQPPPTLSEHERVDLEQHAAELMGVRAVSMLDAGGGVLMAGHPAHGLEGSLELIAAMLADVLRLRSMQELAERRIQNLDMGIAWTAHELRGPLLGVRAVIELMLQRDRGSGPDQESLRRASAELDRLAGTAESLLSWAVGARSLDLKRSDVIEIVEEAVQTCRLESGVDRVVVSAPPRAIARVDSGMMQTAFVNLVRNALAHASLGTKVEVDIECDRERVLVSVRDYGPKIPIVERDSIFDPFVRGSTGGSGGKGNGLGLFIARRIVRAHAGDIWVESDLEATTFLVTLPIEQPQERRVAS